MESRIGWFRVWCMVAFGFVVIVGLAIAGELS